ncbi:hypothetical protein H6F67_04340 [Microcoleus sp. FACHB-1515]|uniref:hypothetical protein n=1 Tax=Cyanophyceae TaxID=3028117 RepID=UPI00168A28E0|nr:hypothetical protein [Microcoleus sp. FACHB-1515]MBD2089082.1 hypothetical protein [Microcoleus sp. FACHB-1515]
MVADERLRQARNILVTPSFRRNDSVQTNDRVDLRSFRLTSRSSVQINLSRIKRGANVDVQLFSLKNPNRALRRIGNTNFASLTRQQRNQFITNLGTARRPGNAAESLTRTLDSGQYYLSVQYRSGRGRVNYRLAAAASPITDNGGEDGGENGGSTDRGGNSPGSATPIEIDFTDRVILDTVGGSDPNDYYRFTISPENAVFSRGAIFNLSLTDLTADLNVEVRDVEVRDASNALVGSSTNSGNANEAIAIGTPAEPLAAGDYLIRVFPAASGQSGSYRLTYSASPVDRALNTPEEALDITGDLVATSIDAPFNFSQEFVGGVDNFDYYKFTVPEGGNFTSVTVEPSQGRVNVALFRSATDPNDPNRLILGEQVAQEIAQPPRIEGEGESANRISDGFGGTLDDLPPGTYFLRIDSNPASQGVLYDLIMYTQPRNDNPTIARDINPGRRPSSPAQFTVVGNSLFFVASDPTGRSLWRADGRNAAQLGTLGSVKKVDLGRNLVFDTNANLVAGRFNNEDVLYFIASTGNGQTALWRTNGLGATEQIFTLASTEGQLGLSISGQPVNVNDTLYFVATGRELVLDQNGNPVLDENGNPTSRSRTVLYQSNGTASGTIPVSGLSNLDRIGELTAIGNTLYFAGADGLLEVGAIGEEVWRITSPGAAPESIDVVQGGGSSTPTNFFGVTNPSGQTDIYFVAQGSDGVDRLWSLAAGASQAVQVNNAPANTARISEDPTANIFGGSPNFTVFNGQLYFTAIGTSPTSTQAGNSIGRELWRVNNGAIELVADLKPNDTSDASSDPRQLTVVNSTNGATLYFTADNGTSGVELWSYSGSGEPTLVDLNATPILDNDVPTGRTASSNPQNLTADDTGNLYFTATAPSLGGIEIPSGTPIPDGTQIGTELWRISADGTRTAFDILPGAQSSLSTTQLTSLLGRLFFSANNGAAAPGSATGAAGNGEELWVIG